MSDYIYLLENRLSPAQRAALRTIREVARSKSLTVFLVGGAVRDLTSGSPVRDLDVVVQGDAMQLREDLEAAGGLVVGENKNGQALFFTLPGGVRLEIGSTLSVSYPKPGQPVYKPATIQEDLRRRDFTANAMALSLNEGSYALLMDPLNGVADIENRELRLVSNYGFIEEPVRMIRAARLMARLGWSMDEKTQQRYETGKAEDYISALSPYHCGYELEEIVHEEDPLRVMKRLETEGWMQHLAPYWSSGKVNAPELERLHEVQNRLQMHGIHPDPSALNFPPLTSRLSASEVGALKATFPRQGFVSEIDSLEARTKELAAQLTGKAAALPSQSWKILTGAAPEVVLSLMFSSRSPALQAKFTNFTGSWPNARQKMPYALMQEMRITPELPGYDELLETLFFELMDDKLQTADEMKAFLEPYSPPAPPPPVNLRRARAGKKDSKATKSRAKKAIVVSEDDEDADNGSSDDLDDVVVEALDMAAGADSDDSDAADRGGDDDKEASDGDDDEDDLDDEEDDAEERSSSSRRVVTRSASVSKKSGAAAGKSGALPAKTSLNSSPVSASDPEQAEVPPAVVAKQASRKAAPGTPATKKAEPAAAAKAEKSSSTPAPAKKAVAVAVPEKTTSAKAVATKGGTVKAVAAKSIPAKATPAKSSLAKAIPPAKGSSAKGTPVVVVAPPAKKTVAKLPAKGTPTSSGKPSAKTTAKKSTPPAKKAAVPAKGRR